jgi:hypothetical protein
MNKRGIRKLVAGLPVMGGILLVSNLCGLGLGWDFSLTLGIIFAIAIWLGIVWIVENVFGE